mgnify:CR=1 FL=1
MSDALARPAGIVEDRAILRRLRLVSLVEGTTLLVLLFIAAPLRHVGGLRAATAIVGPVHGLAFLFYVWAVIEASVAGGWPKREVALLLVRAFVPFGAFLNERSLRRREAALADPIRPADGR